MKKSHKQNKLTLNKVQITELKNMHQIKGGFIPSQILGMLEEEDDIDTWGN